jgi:phosphoglycerate dehydrogenase-like enzyme
VAPVPVHIGPSEDARIAAAVRRGGGRPVPPREAEAIVWLSTDVDKLAEVVGTQTRWIQLPAAGVEDWVTAGIVDDSRAWTSARGVYAETVAEHALALLLAGARRLHECARALEWGEPGSRWGRVVQGSTVAVVGAGGIGQALIDRLQPLEVRVVAVTRSGRQVHGAQLSLDAGALERVWPEADFVVLAAPATAGTRHLVGREQLAAMRAEAWLVNVARGSLIDTDALVDALEQGTVGGAALDVTDPEPLPDDHPLWRQPRALITPHAANPWDALMERLAERIEENVRRFAEGRELSESDARELATGEVFNGATAVDLGLVDVLGGLDAAVAEAEDLAGIEDAEIIDLRPTFFEIFFGGPSYGIEHPLERFFRPGPVETEDRVGQLRQLLETHSGPRYEVP